MGTVAYLLAVSIYALIQRQAVLNMTPNQFADFLAGCFAPLAFLWLVLGFFQQGDELRNSVTALKLQGEELRHSVEQQRQLVEVTREQLGIDRASQDAAAADAARKAAPIFHISGGFSGWSSPIITSKFTISNVGAECRQLVFDDGIHALNRIPLFRKGDRFDIDYQLSKEAEANPVLLIINCVNSLGQQLTFQTKLEAGGGYYGPEYKVTSESGLFAQVVEVGLAVENNELSA
jgi:hypothetical protein